jgi:hypothetical protein
MYRYIKAIAAFVGSLSPLAITGILAFLKVPLPADPDTVLRWSAAASTVLGTLATVLVPPNTPKAEDDKLGADVGEVVNELAARLAPKK